MDTNELVELAESLKGQEVTVGIKNSEPLTGILDKVMFNTVKPEFAIALADENGKAITILLKNITSLEATE